MSKLLTLDEACEILRCSKRTLHRAFVDGLIPRVKIGRKTLIEEKEIEKFIKRSRAS